MANGFSATTTINRPVGEVFAFLADGENDFASVNARLVSENAGRDPDEVVRALRESSAELDSYVRALPTQVWEAPTGVLYAGRQVTIASSVAVLAHDIEGHRRDLGA